MNRIARAGSVAAVVLTAAACATTTFQSTWKAPEVGPLNLRARRWPRSSSARTRASAFPPRTRSPSRSPPRARWGSRRYTLVSDDVIQDQEKSRALMEKAGVAGVVSMRVVSNEQRITSTPSTFWVGPPHSAFWGRPGWGRPGYWGWGWNSSFATPMIQTDTVVSIETLIFDMGRDKLVWVATSRTTNPSNVPSFIREVSGAAAGALRRQGLIQ